MVSTRGCIAIVDDDPGVRKALERLLRAARFDTHTFGSAEEFLDSSASGPHVCLILDIKLPGISGLELSRRLEEGNAHLPTIFITAQPGNWECGQANCPVSHQVCLYKPFPAAALLSAVESALSRPSPPAKKNRSEARI